MKILRQIRHIAPAFALVGATGSIGCQVCPCNARGPASVAAAATTPTASEPAGTVEGSKSVKAVPYQWKSVTILGGGFVSGIIFSPVAKDLIYARTDVGGAYRYNPADKSWIPLTDMFPRDTNFLGIESIAPDPVDANKVYMAVGTYVQSWAGNGAILRSSDKGASWKKADMPIKMGGNEYGRSNGERLAVDPHATNTLFFGSRKNSLWKSTDAGASWNKVDTFPVATDPNGIGIVFVLFDPKSGAAGKPTQHLYAGVAKTESGAGLYESADGGATWKPVPKQPTGVMPTHAAFDANGLLYLSYANGPGPNDVTDGSVNTYNAKNGSWSNITPAAPSGADKFGYGGLAVDAAHPGTLMVTTIDRWTKGDEIFRTVDGGKSWKALNPTAVHDDAGAHYLYWERDKPSSSGWMGDIDIDPFNPGHAMYVTGQGLWATDDATSAEAGKPTHWVFLDRNLEETVVAGLSSPPSGPPLLSSVGDLGGFRHDDLDKPSPTGMFQTPIFGSGTGLDFAWKKPEIVARVGYAGGAGKHGAISIDGGKTWKPFAAEPPGNGAGSIAVSADGETFVWAPKGGNASFSHDRGATWVRAEGLPEPAKIPDWAPINLRPAADRVNPQKMYAYDSLKGRSFASTDGGAHFVETSSTMPNLPDYNLGSGSAQTTPGVEGDVWLTTGKELYHSTDSGKSYKSLSNVDESDAVGFGKAPPGKDYPALYLIGKVGGNAGFFRSDDGGTNWVRINDEQHQYGFTGVITGDPRVYGRVYIGTGGRGILYADPK
jgi:photosystem II stability/assembly factor-like uncharacterized protein